MAEILTILTIAIGITGISIFTDNYYKVKGNPEKSILWIIKNSFINIIFCILICFNHELINHIIRGQINLYPFNWQIKQFEWF